MTNAGRDRGRMRRRAVLRGIGGLALTLPFLPSLQGESRAGTFTLPKRFVYVSMANGELPSWWWPTHAFQWKPLAGDVREAALTEAVGSGGLNAVLGPELDPFLSKAIFLRGLDLIGKTTSGHVPSSPVSGARGGDHVTIDQMLANSSAVYSSAPAVRSLHLMSKAVWQAEAQLSVAPEGGVYCDASPSVSFDRLFSSYVPDDDPEAKKVQALELSVMDRVREQYARLIAHPRLGKQDRERLTAHVELVHDLQQRLKAPARVCAPPASAPDPTTDNEPGLDAWTARNIELITAAFACDRTRVAVLELCVGTDLRQEHHNLVHSLSEPGNYDKVISIRRHYTSQLAQLLGALDSVVEDPQSGATLLDNSLVLFSNEDGCTQDMHIGCSQPSILFGSAAGALKTGRYLDYRPLTYDAGQEVGIAFIDAKYGPIKPPFCDWRGRCFNSLLLSILEAMGETAPSDGIGDYTNNLDGQFDEAEMRKPLPFLTPS